MRRFAFGFCIAVALTGCSSVATGSTGRVQSVRESAPAHADPSAGSRFTPAAAEPGSDTKRLTLIRTIGGAISPKSVAASQTGLVLAQNMMYRHTITVYASSGALLRTIPDAVRVAGHPGVSHGAPVEAAYSPDHRYAYVSNYSMYGVGWGREGSDVCSPRSAARAGVVPSTVYRVDLRTLRVDRVIQVGLVPKFLAVTPDNRYLLVSNWCSYTVSVVAIASQREIRQIYVGPYPRGIAVTPDSSTAYVAVMGTFTVVPLSLRRLTLGKPIEVGNSPRQVVLGPSARYLFVTLNGEGSVARVDLRSRRVVARVRTGRDPRSMAIAPDGKALFVVNYLSDTVTVLRARDLAVLQVISTGVHPIGVTYDGSTGRVWVAVYSGKIMIFRDGAAA